MIGRIIFAWVLLPAFIASLPLLFVHSITSNDAVSLFVVNEEMSSGSVKWVLFILAIVGVLLMTVPDRKARLPGEGE